MSEQTSTDSSETLRREALRRLDVLVGDWTVDVELPNEPTGRVSFEWTLDGQYLIQRSQIGDPVPDSLAVIGVAPDGATYVQHYFDARGVVRTYAMTLGERVWTLERLQPDFSPLDFAQRYTGELSSDGDRITGAWEAREPGDDWRVDFHLTYTRATS